MGTKTAKPSKQPTAKPGKGKPPAPGGADAPTPPAAPQPAGLVAPALPPVEYRGTLPLGRLRPSPTNPRKTLDPASVAELAASIGSLGLLQPLLVRPVGPAPKMGPKGWEGVDHFEVIAGERRFRALDLNGAAEAAVTCRLLTDAEVAWVQLVENDQREDVRPSERAAAYAAIAAAGQTAEQIAAATGVALSAVRDLVRLARLPAWALAAVDRGVLPVATAALVAKVPGEQARARAACEVLLDVALLAGDDADDFARKGLRGPDPVPMSYRDAKRHLQEYYTRQLKGSPFSLKMADLLPDAGSCDACPKRAGNDPEAKAEGVRADVCLDPDCYRAKVEAYRAAETAKAEAKGAVAVPEDFAWPLSFGSAPMPPKGWCPLDVVVTGTELGAEFPPGKAPPLTLAKVLGKESPQQYLAFHGDKPRLLVRTAEARKALQAGGVLKKPERKPAPPKAERPAPSTDTGSKPAGAATESPKSGKPLVEEVNQWDAEERAAEIGARVLGEMAADECGDVDAAAVSLRMVARFLIRDHCEFGEERRKFVTAALGFDPGRAPSGDMLYHEAADKLTPPEVLGLCVRLAAAPVLDGEGGAKVGFGHDLLEWGQLDWPQLLDQAGRELAGGPTADERIAAAEAADAGKAGAA